MFKRSAVLMLLKIFSVFFGLIFTIAVTRTLGAKESGEYFLVFTIVSVFSVICRLGLDQTIVRFTAIAKDKKDDGFCFSLLFNCLAPVIILSASVSLLLYFSSDFIAGTVFKNESLGMILKSMSFSVFGISVLTIAALSFQGMGRSISTIVLRDLAVRVTLTLALMIFALNSAKDVAELYSWVAVGLAGFAVLSVFRVLRTKFSFSNIKLEKNVRKRIVSSCMPLWVVAIMSELVNWSSQIISGIYVTEESLAYLAVAQRISVLTSLILIVVNMIVSPQFAALYENKKIKELSKLANDAVKLNFFLATPVLLILMLFPEFILSIFGEDFVEGANLLIILGVGQFVNVVTGPVGYLLTMTGHERVMRNVVIASAIFSVLISFTLIPVFGVLGAAIATMLAISFQNILASFMVYKVLDIKIFVL